jgi:hypothetical protein
MHRFLLRIPVWNKFCLIVLFDLHVNRIPRTKGMTMKRTKTAKGMLQEILGLAVIAFIILTITKSTGQPPLPRGGKPAIEMTFSETIAALENQFNRR